MWGPLESCWNVLGVFKLSGDVKTSGVMLNVLGVSVAIADKEGRRF